MKKISYPNNVDFVRGKPSYDIQKWVDTVKQLRVYQTNGYDRNSCLKNLTANWNENENYDFMRWLNYYDSMSHEKYSIKTAEQLYNQIKTAQFYEGSAPGYLLPIHKDEEVISAPPNFVKEDKARLEEKRKNIEEVRKKLIGRLDSAEKLLRTEKGQMFSGNELETLMESIYQLKKKIFSLNKVSLSFKTYEDMIIREGNILAKKGFNKSASYIHKIAEDIPNPISASAPTENTGVANGLPEEAIGGVESIPPGGPATGPNNSILGDAGEEKKSTEQFLENLETGGLTEDNSDSEDMNWLKDIEVNDELISEAQVSPDINVDTSQQSPTIKTPEETQTPIKTPEITQEKSDPVSNSEENVETTTSFDSSINNALSNINVSDIVLKLEALSKIFKTREVPRQLSIVDMMLDQLNMASFFPSLSEAINKSLESNNYISTRIEDVLSKLRGAMKTNDIDLSNESNNPLDPQTQNIQKNLEEQDNKETKLKEMRREKQNKELENSVAPEVQAPPKEEPSIEIEEPVAAPVQPITPATK